MRTQTNYQFVFRNINTGRVIAIESYRDYYQSGARAQAERYAARLETIERIPIRVTAYKTK